jgi:hypothetical protein
MQIFLSYSRKNQEKAKMLAKDIQDLGHSVWLDQELTGGQTWWEQILSKVQRCDVFIFALSPESLDSTACNREWDYAHKLNKRILPVLVTDISQNLLPSELSIIQFVDYRKPHEKQVAFILNKALQNLPPPQPLPNPLPEAPEVPISYLSNLKDEIENLPSDFDSQIALYHRLKDNLGNVDEYQDTRELLIKLKGHEDLLAKVAREIDVLLANTPAPSSRQAPHVESGRVEKENYLRPLRVLLKPVQSRLVDKKQLINPRGPNYPAFSKVAWYYLQYLL